VNDRVFAGIDGGATHARALIISEQGRELARATGPAGIVDPHDPLAAAAAADRLIRRALGSAGVQLPITALCCGLAGTGLAAARDAVRAALLATGVADIVLVASDAEAAMADAFGAGPGVLLIAGTGSIAWARNEGPPVRAGGWGALIGDEGSGYAIGIAAVRAVTRAADGREPPTKLTGPVFQHAGIDDAAALPAWVAAAGKAVVAALAPAVLRCAELGDTAAARIRADAVAALTELAVCVTHTAALADPRIALAGGLVQPDGPLREPVAAAILQALPAASIADAEIDAARGAAALAAIAAGAYLPRHA
jgi:glucosamine kinase